MVSHKLHEEWCVKLGIPREICREVNVLIDIKCRKHDVGRREKFVYAGAGGIRIPIVGKGRRYVGKTIKGVPIRMMYVDVEDLIKCLKRFYGDTIPDSVVKSAILHHFLDEIKNILENQKVSLNAKEIIDEVARRLELLKRFNQRAFHEVYIFLQNNVQRVVESVLKEIE